MSGYKELTNLDNVLYEISNESEYGADWHNHLAEVIHDYEKAKPKRHPVGITGGGPTNAELFAGPADWISPTEWTDPPANDGRKVVIIDTDHIGSVDRTWIWRSLLRGHNPILMDWMHKTSPWYSPADQEAMRKAMGQTLKMANRMNLAEMTPRNDLASSGYCLANPGKEYLVYLPKGGEVTMDLSGTSGKFVVEWLDSVEGTAASGPPIDGGAIRSLQASSNAEAVLYLKCQAPASFTGTNGAPAKGPLRAHPANARYFTDGTKRADGSLRAVYLTGSHHWHNLQDAGRLGGPLTKKFDYDGYLQLLTKLNHNFMRMWAWEGGAWWWQGGENDEYYAPIAYSRAGSGTTTDGKPKFDLSQFNPEYFERLRSRVAAAGNKGIYVGVMLFQGWSIYNHDYGNPWPLHPFNVANNVNGINGDADKDGEGREVHSLDVPAVTRLQEAYVRKVIDTLNDLDNVLYEITNETAIFSREWQYHVVRYIKEYEASKPKQHPVGMTAFDSGGEGSMAALLASPADWISPQNDGVSGDYQDDPPAADGRKVSISDTDHLWGVGGDRVWVWKSFTRGHHPIYMDPLRKQDWFSISEAEMEDARKAMGQTRRIAERVDLAALAPHGELASSGYCLAARGKEYLVYLPRGGEVTVDLTAAPGTFVVEWIHPVEGTITTGKTCSGGSKRTFVPPSSGDAVLHIRGE